MNNRFLLEIYTEEVPYRLQKELSENIKVIWENLLSQNKVKYSEIKVFSTAKRMVVLISGLPSHTEEHMEEKRGPEITASSQVIDAFCKGKNIQRENLLTKEVKGKNYYFANIYIPSKQIKDILANYLITEVLANVKFQKAMVWNKSKQLWARPIRNILALFEEDTITNVLNMEFANVQSSSYIYGHNIISPKKIHINNIEEYFLQLKEHQIILDCEQRKNMILANVKQIEKYYNAKAFLPEYLLEEIAYIVEYPHIFIGEIPSKYLILPKELLVDIAVTNQRYITLSNPDETLVNKFIIVANNLSPDNGKVIIAGNEKVLAARLQDGLFFYNQDISEDFLLTKEKLKSLNYFTNLGTLYDKVERVKQLFNIIFQEDQSLLCDLYKNDLVSAVVFEIPALQGTMGKYYALKWGLDNNILNIETLSIAIADQYKPLGSTDSLPRSVLGAKLAFLDKLDSLIQFFSIGEQPTGSKDPYALRRFALGIIRIIIDNNFDINLREYVSDKLYAFILDRLLVYLKSLSSHTINFDYFKEIIKVEQLNVLKIYQTSLSLNRLFSSNDGLMIWELYQRVKNILIANKLDHDNTDNGTAEIDETLLENNKDKDLYNSLLFVKERQKSISMQDIQFLLQQTNDYLNNVLVMDKNIKIKDNRCLILQQIKAIIAEFITSVTI